MSAAVRKQKADPVRNAAIDYFASRSHDAWRRTLLASNPEQKGKLRMRLRGGVMVDINQPWSALHPKAKQDNMRAARDAYDAVRKFPNDREAAARWVHEAWIRRNKADPNQAKALFKPYARLPELEKDKDRAHVDNMKRALAAARRKAPGKRAKKRKTARAPNSVAVDLKTWRELEAAARRLSIALGRAVSPEILVTAAVQAPAERRGKR
jgi:hypothetical protein